jgi:hypothetical protein
MPDNKGCPSHRPCRLGARIPAGDGRCKWVTSLPSALVVIAKRKTPELRTEGWRPEAGVNFRDRRPQGCGRSSLQGRIHGVSRKVTPASGQPHLKTVSKVFNNFQVPQVQSVICLTHSPSPRRNFPQANTTRYRNCLCRLCFTSLQGSSKKSLK